MKQIEGLAGRRNAALVQEAAEERELDPVHSELDQEEWNRILSLPIREPAVDKDIDPFSYKEVDAVAYDNGFRLRLKQVDAIREYDNIGSALVQASVGSGKSLVCTMMAVRALRKGMKRALILVPAQVYQQLMVIDLPRMRSWAPVSFPFVGLGGGTGERRKTLIASAREKTVFVLPYSLLSRGDPRALLASINPDIVIADEAHYLKARDSARTKRFLDHMKAHPHCKFVAMSGTLTSKSLADYHHLAVLALRERAPMPKGATQGAIWASMLDATSQATAEKAKVLQPLRIWAREHRGIDTPYTVDGFREAYRARLESAPGCVLTRRPDDLETSLIFETIETELPPDSKLHEHFKNLEGLWLSPTGDEIAHAIHLYKWRYELTAGFYYALVWPEARNDAHQKLIDRAKEHHVALQDYHKDLRAFLSTTSIHHLDTPMLVGAGIARGEKRIPAQLAMLWHRAKNLEFEGMPKRQQSPVRVDDYKIRLARDWAATAKSGIIWVHHQEMLDWLCDEIPGIIPARAGTTELLKPENKNSLFVASMGAHGTGKNLQHFQNQLFLQWPRPANEAEQVLGRLHRPGQEADEITAHIAMGIEFDHQLFCATLSDALYIYLTTGAEQKLLYGTYAKPPKIYEPRLLDKLGFQGDLKKVDVNKLKEKFGT